MSKRTRQEGATAGLIAVVSTVVFFTAVALLVANSPAWPQVRQQFFSGSDFAASFPKVLSGFWLNLKLFAICLITIPLVALFVAVGRALRGPGFAPIRILMIAYTDLLRGVPLILLVFLLGFGVPPLDIAGLPKSPVFWGIVALTLSYSAYTAEIYRAGINAVPESQRSSARALGLTQSQTLRHAVFPQAIRNVIPALMNTVVSLQKDVALISILGVREAVREAEIYKARTFNFTSYVVATLLFLAISVPLTRIVDTYTDRYRKARNQAQL